LAIGASKGSGGRNTRAFGSVKNDCLLQDAAAATSTHVADQNRRRQPPASLVIVFPQLCQWTCGRDWQQWPCVLATPPDAPASHLWKDFCPFAVGSVD